MSDIEEAQPSEPPVVQEAGDMPVEMLGELQVRSSLWSGPLPAPADLQLFEEIVPGAANRILTLTEKQVEHRIDLERTVVRESPKRSHRGLAAGFVLSAAVILGGIFLIYSGHDWAGGVLVGINLVGLASVFVLGSNAQRARQSERLESLVEKADLQNGSRQLQDSR